MNVYPQVENILAYPTRRMDVSFQSFRIDDGSSSIRSEPLFMDYAAQSLPVSSQTTELFESQSAMDNRSIAFDQFSFRSQNTFPKHYSSSGLDTNSISSALSFRNQDSLLSSYYKPSIIKEKKEPFNPIQMKHTPDYSLNKGVMQCPLYSVVFQTTGTRLSVGHNSDFATYLLTSLFDEFTYELRLNHITVDGYYLNDHGFFVIVPPGTKELEIDNVISLLSNKHSKKYVRSQRLRIPLNSQTYLNYLIYIAETTKGLLCIELMMYRKVVVHRVNEEVLYYYGDEEEVKKVFEEAQCTNY